MPIHVTMVYSIVSFWRFGVSKAKETSDLLFFWLPTWEEQTYFGGAGRRSSNSLS
jgi:hypothetical protein